MPHGSGHVQSRWLMLRMGNCSKKPANQWNRRKGSPGLMASTNGFMEYHRMDLGRQIRRVSRLGAPGLLVRWAALGGLRRAPDSLQRVQPVAAGTDHLPRPAVLPPSLTGATEPGDREVTSNRLPFIYLTLHPHPSPFLSLSALCILLLNHSPGVSRSGLCRQPCPSLSYIHL